jgi:hypothetical protein
MKQSNEVTAQELQLEWVRRRLEELEKINAKLVEMQQLASYAASGNLNPQESAQIQEWFAILQAELKVMEGQAFLAKQLGGIVQ